MKHASWRRAAVLCALAGALAACGGFAPQPLPVSAKRIQLSCFSFLPPSEFGWMTAPADPGSFAATRAGVERDDLYVFLAEAKRVAPIARDEELLEFGRKTATPTENDSVRVAVTSSDVSLWPRLRARCVRMAVSGVSRSDPNATFQTVSFACLNPHSDDVVILLLGQRCARGQEDPTLPQKAEELALTLEFLAD